MGVYIFIYVYIYIYPCVYVLLLYIYIYTHKALAGLTASEWKAICASPARLDASAGGTNACLGNFGLRAL